MGNTYELRIQRREWLPRCGPQQYTILPAHASDGECLITWCIWTKKIRAGALNLGKDRLCQRDQEKATRRDLRRGLIEGEGQVLLCYQIDLFVSVYLFPLSHSFHLLGNGLKLVLAEGITTWISYTHVRTRADTQHRYASSLPCCLRNLLTNSFIVHCSTDVKIWRS